MPGFFVALALLFGLQMLLLALVGWWVGKRVAFCALSLRGAAIAATVVGLIPFLFWYPSIGIFIEPDSERFARDFPGHARAYWSGLLLALVPAGASAAISWVLHLDEYLMLKRREKPE